MILLLAFVAALSAGISWGLTFLVLGERSDRERDAALKAEQSAHQEALRREIDVRDGLLAGAEQEIGDLRRDLLAATEEKTGLRKRLDRALVDSDQQADLEAASIEDAERGW